MSADTKILELSIKRLTQQLDKLVGECMGENGGVKAPSKRTVIDSRASLPKGCDNSYN